MGQEEGSFNEPSSSSLSEERISRGKNCNKILDHNCFVCVVFSGHIKDAIDRDNSVRRQRHSGKPRIKIREKPSRQRSGNPDQIVVR